MTWTNRVLWREGMFLRAQHFQQQDRYLDQVGRARLDAVRSYGWGVQSFSLNRALLATGQFAVTAASGLFDDGTPFAVPAEQDLPPALTIPPNTRNAIVSLALAEQQPGAQEVAENDSSGARWDPVGFNARDTQSGSPEEAPLEIGKLRLHYRLDTETASGYTRIALARIQEVTPDRRVILDENWIPPALKCASVTPLTGFIQEFAGLLAQRADALAARLCAPGRYGAADTQDFMALTTMNRWQALLTHWSSAPNIHPVTLYEALLELAGELSTFYAPNRRISDYPPYRHEDLQRSYQPLIADLRRLLSFTIDPNAFKIPLNQIEEAPIKPMWVGVISDRSLLSATMFVLVAKADVPNEDLRRLLPAHAKLGAVERIVDLVHSQLTGIPIDPLSSVPRQLPFYGDWCYFALEKQAREWQDMQKSNAFAIHVSGARERLPGLRFELWAIRGLQ